MATRQAYPRVRMKSAGGAARSGGSRRGGTELHNNPFQTRETGPRINARYEAGGGGERALEKWIGATGGSSEYELGASLDVIRRRCRYEVRNNPIASSLNDYIANTTVARV